MAQEKRGSATRGRSATLRCRVSEGEERHVKKGAADAGLTVSEYLRSLVLGPTTVVVKGHEIVLVPSTQTDDSQDAAIVAALQAAMKEAQGDGPDVERVAVPTVLIQGLEGQWSLPVQMSFVEGQLVVREAEMPQRAESEVLGLQDAAVRPAPAERAPGDGGGDGAISPAPSAPPAPVSDQLAGGAPQRPAPPAPTSADEGADKTAAQVPPGGAGEPQTQPAGSTPGPQEASAFPPTIEAPQPEPPAQPHPFAQEWGSPVAGTPVPAAGHPGQPAVAASHPAQPPVDPGPTYGGETFAQFVDRRAAELFGEGRSAIVAQQEASAEWRRLTTPPA